MGTGRRSGDRLEALTNAYAQDSHTGDTPPTFTHPREGWIGEGRKSSRCEKFKNSLVRPWGMFFTDILCTNEYINPFGGNKRVQTTWRQQRPWSYGSARLTSGSPTTVSRFRRIVRSKTKRLLKNHHHKFMKHRVTYVVQTTPHQGWYHIPRVHVWVSSRSRGPVAPVVYVVPSPIPS